jgi:cytochrome c oxidase subunit 4
VTEASGEGVVATTEHDVERAIERAEEHLPAELVTSVQYVIVAVILVVITGLEIAVSYTEGTIPDGLIVVLLLVMAFVKFFLVASWYMHLRTDKPVFRRFFIMGGSAAILLYLVVLATLHGIE